MVALPQMFDATTVEPASGYSPLPEGWYTCVIVASELKDTKARDGKFIAIDRKVIAAENTATVGRTFTERLNVYNPSQQAMEIAQRQLSAICHVTGVFKLTDTTQLHNIPHRVRLDVTVNDQGKPNGNNVQEYQDANGNPPHKAGAGPAMVSPQGSHSAVQAPVAPQQPAYAPPAQAQPPATGWGAPPAQPPAQAPQQPPTWGAPQPNGQAAPQPNGQAAPQQPAAPASWGAPPAGQAAPPPAWGAPPAR